MAADKNAQHPLIIKPMTSLLQAVCSTAVLQPLPTNENFTLFSSFHHFGNLVFVLIVQVFQGRQLSHASDNNSEQLGHQLNPHKS